MKLEANKDIYDCPLAGKIQRVFIEMGSYAGSVYLVKPEQMAETMRRAPMSHGTPCYAAHIGNTSTASQLQVHPTPDTDGVLRVWYYPPLREA